MKVKFCSETKPGFMVMVAGFQKIDETPPEPEAAPAKARPCAWALCSRIPNAPACACPAPRITAVAASIAARTVPPIPSP